MTTETHSDPGDGGLYFFLSHAHGASEAQAADPDVWVRAVFQDMCAVVDAKRRARSWELGYLDSCPPGSTPAEEVAKAIGSAEVFVPLYSNEYLGDQRPLRQLAAFVARLEKGGGQTNGHVLPVLWEPSVAGEALTEFQEALRIAEDVPEYAENGLAGLSRLSGYRPAYEKLMALLGRWIVDVAEGAPLGAGPTRSPAEDTYVAPRAAFVVAVLAPYSGAIPGGRMPDTYGQRPAQWRPYGRAQPLPIAYHVARRPPDRLYETVVVDYSPDNEVIKQAPGILLIDPWILADPPGRTQLSGALRGLSPWIMPLVVANIRDPQFDDAVARLTDEAADLCASGRLRAPRRRDVRDLDLFDELVDQWVTEANRQFSRRNRRAKPDRRYPGRPRLLGRGSSEGVEQPP